MSIVAMFGMDAVNPGYFTYHWRQLGGSAVQYEQQTIVPGAGRFGGGCLRLWNDRPLHIQPLENNTNRVGIGGWFKHDGVRNYTGKIMRFTDGTTVQASLGLNASTGYLYWYRQNDVNYGNSGAEILAPGTWYWLEAACTVGNAGVGDFEVRVNNTLIHGDNTQDFQGSSAYCNGGQIEGPGNYSDNYGYWDDVVMWVDDGSGHEGFLGDLGGDIRIDCLLPTGDGANQDWTRSAGVNSYALVDDPFSAAAGTSEYLASATPGDLCDLSFGGLNAQASRVLAVDTFSAAHKPGYAAKSARLNVKSGATTVNGQAIHLPAHASVMRYTKNPILELDPDTSLSWSQSGAENMTVQLELLA
ncbi:MAG: hypothetical protein ACPGO3_09875 [Magnetospiraceae bacterium]